MNWVQILLWLGPIIMNQFPKLVPLTSQLTEIIREVEQLLGSGTGPQKREEALRLLRIAVVDLNALEGHVVLDPDLAVEIAGPVIDLVVLMVNTFQRTAPAVVG